MGKRTNEAKYVLHAGHKYNKHINQEHEGKCDAYVPGPMEGFFIEQNLKNSSANLQMKGIEKK